MTDAEVAWAFQRVMAAADGLDHMDRERRRDDHGNPIRSKAWDRYTMAHADYCATVQRRAREMELTENVG